MKLPSLHKPVSAFTATYWLFTLPAWFAIVLTQPVAFQDPVLPVFHPTPKPVAVEPAPTVGKASWLRYVLDDSCASRDFPKKTKMLVENLETGATTTCVVRDYGPDASEFPDRIVDLDDHAFSEIAPLSRGVVPVTVQALP